MIIKDNKWQNNTKHLQSVAPTGAKNLTEKKVGDYNVR